MADTPNNPHDALFRRTFSVAENAAAELKAILPRALVNQVDWQSLRLCGGSFVDGALASLHSDLLYSVTVSGGRLWCTCCSNTKAAWMR